MKALLALLLLTAAPVAAETIAITGGTVAGTAGGTPIEGGTVVVQNGRIIAVGRNVPVPAGATVIDATGKWVTPGIFSAMAYMGISEVSGVDQTNDSGASKSPFSAAIDLAPGINPAATNIAVERQGGVTRSAIGPNASHEIFGGQGAVISLAASGDIVTRPRAFQFVEMGEEGARAAGGSRPVAFLNFRNALHEAERYAANPVRFEDGRGRDAFVTRLDAAALVPVVQGSQRLLVHVERAQDILNVLALRTEFPRLKLVLFGAREGWLVADRIAAARVPVITQPMLDNPNSFEALASTKSNVGRLVKAGVVVGLGILEQDASFQARDLPNYAGNMVAQARVPGGVGLTWAEALRTVTAAPAEIFGMTDTGTLAAGERGDVVVWDGDPLELTSAPTAMLIDGVRQPLTSRQTELRDRYLGLKVQDAPLQYRR
ncbi:amidohydrolase family protein [Sphingosinicellaceae bacterium]|nr:amidohydrolase family protein [Sphingosinicellaceae bacterium]